MSSIVDWFGKVQIISAAITAFVIASTAVLWRPIKKVHAAHHAKKARILAYRSRNDAMHAMMERLTEDMQAVKAEVKEDGGSTLKDGVNYLRANFGMVDAALHIGEKRALWKRRVVAPDCATTFYLSPEWTRLTGLTRENMDNGGWTKCISPVDRTRVTAAHNIAEQMDELFQEHYTVINVLSGVPVFVAHEDLPVFVGSKLVGWISYMYEVPKF